MKVDGGFIPRSMPIHQPASRMRRLKSFLSTVASATEHHVKLNPIPALKGRPTLKTPLRGDTVGFSPRMCIKISPAGWAEETRTFGVY